jgi:2-haloacid dehalogenase
MIDWNRVKALTFDCYGTLVDWETGILRDVKAGLISRFGKPVEGLVSDEELIRAFAISEPAAQSLAYRTYKEVLKTTLSRIADTNHLRVRDLDALWKGLPTWPVFAETPEILPRLKAKFSLNVITNCDRDLFAETAKSLGAALDDVVTAEDVQAYKPSPKPFLEMLARLAARGIDKDAVVHVASSKYHDLVPAKEMGLVAALVVRPAHRKSGASAVPTHDAVPDLQVASLAALAESAGV